MKAEMVMGSSISCSLMELQARESKVESDQDSPPNFAIASSRRLPAAMARGTAKQSDTAIGKRQPVRNAEAAEQIHNDCDCDMQVSYR